MRRVNGGDAPRFGHWLISEGLAKFSQRRGCTKQRTTALFGKGHRRCVLSLTQIPVSAKEEFWKSLVCFRHMAFIAQGKK